jgi:F420-dependent oxidoreductase-like protein
MQFGIDTAQQQQTWPQLLERVRWCEDAGFDGIWLFDHFQTMYADPLGPCLESWTLMAALGAATARIRLGTMVTGMTYRHPSMLAMEAVTIDHVSNGRLELAVGAAWFEKEHHELGFPFPPVGRRARMLEEGVQAIKLLMTEDYVSFEGDTIQLRNAYYRPRPVQSPHPPVWIGAAGEKVMIPIAARQANVWHCGSAPDNYRRKSVVLDRAAEAAGRDPSDIRRAATVSLEGDMDQVRRAIDQFAELGVSYIYAGWPSQGQLRVAEYAEHVIPAYRA